MSGGSTSDTHSNFPFFSRTPVLSIAASGKFLFVYEHGRLRLVTTTPRLKMYLLPTVMIYILPIPVHSTFDRFLDVVRVLPQPPEVFKNKTKKKGKCANLNVFGSLALVAKQK